MRAQSIKHYKNTPLHAVMLEIAKEVTYTNWWNLVFPDSQMLAKILCGGDARPHQNKEIYVVDGELHG